MDSLVTPIQKNVVLVGAGNAHLRFVKMFGMRPIRGVAVTLVSEAPVIPYSAMVPAHIAGDYPWHAITIDLVRLCRAMNVRLVTARASALDCRTRTVRFPNRPELRFDLLSLGLGSLPACPSSLADSPTSWRMRPLGTLLERLDELERSLKRSGRPHHFVVVGGGASGAELALAIRKRFSALSTFRLTLLHSQGQLLPQFPARVGQIFTALSQQRAITVRLDTRVTGGDAHTLELNGTEQLAYDTVLWATNAAPQDLLASSGLPLSNDGFLRVRDTLQSEGDPTVFGTGDCITLASHPQLLKNGVYAVREGGILYANVMRFLHEKPLKRFHPQSRCLCLLNTADGEAALCYGPLVWKGRTARWLKDRIDRAWIKQFTMFPSMPGQTDQASDAVPMRCGGCGSKISSDVLSAVLKRIEVGDDPRLLLGCHAGEDASVHRMKPELYGTDPAQLVEVQTVDYFKSFVDDPYLFGRIAALNAVSDLYAMNARPFSALAIATLPYARGPVQEGILFELLSGAVHSLRELGVVLAGGHTTEGSELALGFAVTGYGEANTLFQKSHLQPGEVLLLTKPLGSGALLAGWMQGQCRASWFNALLDAMLVANARGGAILAQRGVRACTDVTGFGLAGHLLEMLEASHVSARLDSRRIPLYTGFNEMVEHGIVSTLHADNAKAACRVQGSLPLPAWLFDPQTSGGLLASVKREQAADIVQSLHDAGYPSTAIIGEILTPEQESGGPSLVLV